MLVDTASTINSDDHSLVVGSIKVRQSRSGNIKRCDSSAGIAYISMLDVIRIGVGTYNLVRRVDGIHIERGRSLRDKGSKFPLHIPHEAVPNAFGIKVGTGDPAAAIDGRRQGGAGAAWIEQGDRSTGVPQKPVHVRQHTIESHRPPKSVDTGHPRRGILHLKGVITALNTPDETVVRL